MPTRRSRWAGIAARAAGALLLVLSVAIAGPAAPAAAQEEADRPAEAARYPAFLGLTLAEALAELQARGLDLVFTSQLVRPEMRVEAEPPAGEPRGVLDALLAPHGLVAEDGPGGVVVVVPAAPRPPAPSITGTVRSRETSEPLAGAVVQVVGPAGPDAAGPDAGVEASSDADGRFAIAGLAPGVYTLEARHQDHFPERVTGVRVVPGGAADLGLALRPVPYIRDEIVVRPSELTLLQEEPVAPLALSKSDIEALPHLAGDLFRALSLFPGTAGNDVSAQFHVHGGRRDEVRILLDGQELYEAYHLQDFDRSLSVVAPGGLASASLSTGAFGASHGDRMSGVLDMTTATPSESRETEVSLSLLAAFAGSGGTFAGERGTWLASARRGSIDLASRLFGSEDPAFWDLFAKVGYRLGDRHHLSAHLLHAGDTLEFTEAVGGDEKLFDTDYDSSYLWLGHQAALGRRLLVDSTLSTSRFSRDRRGVEDEEEQSLEVVDRREFDVLGVSQEWAFQASPRHHLEAGFEVRRYDVEYDYFNLVEPDFVLVSDFIPPRDGPFRFAGEFHGDHLGAWAAERFSPVEPLTFEIGLRYDRHTLTGDTLASPRVNAAWRLGETSVLRLAWGHFHQSHRPYELQVEDGETRFFPAERSEHWVVGYEVLLARRTGSPLGALRVEAYRRRIDDPRPRYESLFEPVNVFPEAERDRVRIAPESSRSEGVEVMVQGRAGARADWWLNYAYATAEDRLRGADVRRQTDQTHTVNLYLNTRVGKSWNLSLAWRYHTGWPTTPVTLETVEDEEGEPEPVPVLGPLNSERLPDYHRLDLRASRHWPLRSGRLTFFVDLQNVYDRKNLAGFDIEIDDEAGELVFEDEEWPGFFPSAGISWEF